MILKRLGTWASHVGVLAAALLALPSHAAENERCSRTTNLPPTANFRLDNDLFGKQDQGYTNGALITFVSPNLTDYIADPCLPRLVRRLNQYLDALHPGGFDQQNMIVTLGQSIYTPTDFTRSDLIAEDRPYAGVLFVGLGYNARLGDHMRTSLLKVGVVGPSAYGEQIQDAVHRLIDDELFEGWDHQLRDEPILQLQHERMRRFAPKDPGVWGWDAITHYGGAVGNLATFANTGFEVRVGRYLPDDFGSTPLRPAGENTAPRSQTELGGVFRAHLFFTADVRWAIHDITLDGNTWKDSHSVDRRSFVGYAGIGLAVMKGRWKWALARYDSTREFEGQVEAPRFGSFTISRTL